MRSKNVSALTDAELAGAIVESVFNTLRRSPKHRQAGVLAELVALLLDEPTERGHDAQSN